MSEGFFAALPLPPHMAEAMQRQRDQQIMGAEAEQLSIENFLDGLSAEDTATLRGIFHDLVYDTEGRLAAYYEGICVTMLRVKHDVCPGCGKPKHDTAESLLSNHGVSESGADSATEEGAASSSNDGEIILKHRSPDGTESLFASPDAFDPKPLDKTFVDPKEELVGQKGMLMPEHLAKMNEYNLDDLRDEDSGIILGFICTNCGMRYQSIEDRMLREPDECTGCQQKSAWG